MAKLEVRLLGAPQFALDGKSISGFESKKVSALLIYLVMEAGRAHHRESLATIFWPESTARSAKANLRQALSNLRQAVGDRGSTHENAPFILVSGQTVQFNRSSEYWLDVHEFEERVKEVRHRALDLDTDGLRPVVELYRGDFLQGFFLDDSVTFEEWSLFNREKLHRQMLDLLYQLTELSLQRGDYVQARIYAQRQVELEPWREEAYRQSMRAYALDDQRSAALTQYESCRRILLERLGVAPAKETTQLYHQIRRGELADLALVTDTSPSPVPPPPCPYRGLYSFHEEDAHLFFGREALTQRLVETVRQECLVALIGPSGSGKSSVAYAGLVAQLRRDDGWLIADFRPGTKPLLALASALNPLLPQQAEGQTSGSTARELAERLRGKELMLAELVDQIFDGRPPKEINVGSRRLLLLVDQFEELYTLCPDEECRRSLIDQLLNAAGGSQIAIVLTLRADFMGQALTYRPFADALQDAMLVLGTMSRQELSQAVENPAKLEGVTFEAGLVTRILDDVASRAGNLPLLQFALTTLWERQTGGQLTHSAYEVIGRVEGALASYADQVYAGLDPEEQGALQRVLVQLVHPGEGTADTRRVATREELGEQGWKLMGRLVDARLAVTDRDQVSGKATVEIVHEALISSWSRLQLWMNSDRAFRTWQEQMRVALRKWQDSAESQEALLRGILLAEAEEWLANRRGDLSSPALRFIRASLEAREDRQAQQLLLERRAQSRLWVMVAALALTAVIAIGLSLFAFRQRANAQREAAVSQSLNLASGAQLALQEGNTDLALALAMEANRLSDPPPQAQLTLAEAAYAPGVRRLFQGHEGPVEDLAVVPGNWDRVLSASADGTLILWDLESGELVRRFSGHSDAVHGVGFLPQGEQALSASADGTLILWEVEIGQQLQSFTGHSGVVWDVAVSPDCNLAALACQALSGSADGTLILWDVVTGELVRRFEGHQGPVYAVAISPDGRTALSGSADQSVILWDMASGSIIHQLQRAGAGKPTTVEDPEAPLLDGHEGPVQDVVFGRLGRTAYSVSDDRQIIYWDLEAGIVLRADSFEVGLFSVGLSPDGRYILLGRSDSQMVLWSPYYGQVVLELIGHTGRIQAMAFSPDGRQALSGAADGTMRLWDLRSGSESRSMILDGSALDVTLSPDGDLILLAGATGDLVLWDYASGTEIRRLVGHTETPFAGVLFRPSAEGPLTAISGAGNVFGVSQDNTLRWWNVETGAEIQRFEGHTDRLWDMDVSADGSFAVSASHDGTVRLWNLDQGTGQVLVDVSPQAARSVAISPDGRTILLGLAKGASSTPDFSLHLFDRETGELLRTFSGHSEIVSDVAFSPDGFTALSGSHDKLLILWDIESGQEIRRFVGHTGAVNQVCFSPATAGERAGRWALSAGLDNLIILWDAETGFALRQYRGHVGGVLGLTFTPDGQSLLSVAADDTVREWRIDATQEELTAWIEANRRVSELTEQQRQQYHVQSE